MLEALMKVAFFPKESETCQTWTGYDAQKILRPAFNLGGNLYSGTITSDELIYYWNKEYEVFVQFFTIDNHEIFSKVKLCLYLDKTYHIQMGSKIIGQATLIDYSYS